MRHRTRIPVFLTLLLLVGGCCATAPDPVKADLDAAVALAVEAMETASNPTVPPAQDVVVTSARQHVLDGKYVWVVTFKLRHLLPEDPSEGIVGLGGETFARVDLGTGKVVLGGGD